MLNIHNLSVSFNGEYLFEEITFRLGAGDRVGLIGKNGAGKSTMLRIISGEQEYDTGSIAKDKELRIGFLKQDIDFVRGRTVLQEAQQAFEEIKKLEKQIDHINEQLATRTDYESESYTQLIQDLSEITHQYEIIGGYNYEGETEKVLLGLGFKREDFGKLTDTFSGGWRMRIELAKLLLQSNDILLLDEPTNHLDIESIIWLESFLNNYAGCVILVSHDKMFLDNVTNRTIEISLGQIYDFKKPYSEFMELRGELRDQQLAAQKNQQKEIEQTEKLIDKFRAKASKASMAQSLIKKLDKINRIEVDEDDNAVMNITFPVSVQPGKVVVEAEHVGKSYGDKKVLEDINLLIERGSKIAYVGQNGQGKTTLAKMIIDEIPYTGELKLGHNVQLGYFAQNQADYLDGEKTVHEIMIDSANEKNRSKVRDMLGSFLFRGDEVDKKVKVLSGGERNRLALCKLLLQPFNVLVMDEPTNHLDIKSKNVLKEALKKFEGTLILVSHDRDFLQGLTSRVYEFKNRNVKEYLGDIDYYLEQRQFEDMRAVEKREKQKAAVQDKAEASPKQSYEDQKKLKSLNNRLSKAEASITKLEKELKEKDVALASNYEKTMEQPEFLKKYNSKKMELEKFMKEWEKIQQELDRYN
ncbi:ABC-F family ATP-binding cassette domain-containing protein [Autumnicola psychrophila]|uniref:ABC-F family ATP-binding cassette domain-containing protein n=1 Tax=Autumnicola psychrophila TaxID=3075592 RepID=A0ABU3DRV6_9FLAO|nr:ABC-F family ATP-binding cassette domain-containing protein [Zunongwangia sp. F225]MDT0686434.1 ABC-F family ATP-binding cassette domain-containing protein [Zunongwangia sp. F225]